MSLTRPEVADNLKVTVAQGGAADLPPAARPRAAALRRMAPTRGPAPTRRGRPVGCESGAAARGCRLLPRPGGLGQRRQRFKPGRRLAVSACLSRRRRAQDGLTAQEPATGSQRKIRGEMRGMAKRSERRAGAAHSDDADDSDDTDARPPKQAGTRAHAAPAPPPRRPGAAETRRAAVGAGVPAHARAAEPRPRPLTRRYTPAAPKDGTFGERSLLRRCRGPGSQSRRPRRPGRR